MVTRTPGYLSKGNELIFRDLIGRCMEVYIDDVVIKSTDFQNHLANLEQAFLKMRKYFPKMNPAECAFGVSTGNFLGFLVHQKGIDVDKNKVKAMLEARPLINKKRIAKSNKQNKFHDKV